MDKRFILESDVEGTRLDIFLSQKLSITRSKVKSMIEDGYVRIAGKKPKPSLKIKKNMVIEGEIPEEGPLSVEPQEIPLQILYEDEYLLFVNKPAGMVVHPSYGHREGTLVNAILSYINWPESSNSEQRLRPGIVHRLDKDTTGVILVAKNYQVQERLSRMFKERRIRKTYRALTWGIIEKEEGKIEGNIGRHPRERKRMTVLKKGGKEAVTEYKVISRLNGFTYLEVYPLTGRTHQIRVHLSYIGHPIVGDRIYGKKVKSLAQRPLLHALSLEFKHPCTGEILSVSAPEPEDISDFIKIYSKVREK
jgi:23S rRNA pseudouridine1911/1915/1917 synthase